KYADVLRAVATHKQVLVIASQSQLGWKISGPQGGDLGVGHGVEDQDLILVLPQNVVSVPRRVGQNVDEITRNIDHRTALIGIVVVDQNADNLRHVYGRLGICQRRNHVDSIRGDQLHR